jgi:hypothetical protein
LFTVTFTDAVFSSRLAEHDLSRPPYCPKHDQELEDPGEGKPGEAGDKIPVVQNESEPYEVSVYEYVLFAEPQIPSTLLIGALSAEHVSLLPPPIPIQLQPTDDPGLGNVGDDGNALPEEQKLPEKSVAADG